MLEYNKTQFLLANENLRSYRQIVTLVVNKMLTGQELLRNSIRVGRKLETIAVCWSPYNLRSTLVTILSVLGPRRTGDIGDMNSVVEVNVSNNLSDGS